MHKSSELSPCNLHLSPTNLRTNILHTALSYQSTLMMISHAGLVMIILLTIVAGVTWLVGDYYDSEM